jgi:hypothetical protein
MIHWLFPDNREPRLPKPLRPLFFWVWHNRWALRHPIGYLRACALDAWQWILQTTLCRGGCDDALPAEGWHDKEHVRTCSRCGTTLVWL